MKAIHLVQTAQIGFNQFRAQRQQHGDAHDAHGNDPAVLHIECAKGKVGQRRRHGIVGQAPKSGQHRQQCSERQSNLFHDHSFIQLGDERSATTGLNHQSRRGVQCLPCPSIPTIHDEKPRRMVVKDTARRPPERCRQNGATSTRYPGTSSDFASTTAIESLDKRDSPGITIHNHFRCSGNDCKLLRSTRDAARSASRHVSVPYYRAMASRTREKPGGKRPAGNLSCL